ncbi:MAG: glucose dehydrogenase [Leptothrix sp. (in: Bacteria)]|nr:glucose dehydrogenase [Leptothrix sp. (in: b-proteobacteria)]
MKRTVLCMTLALVGLTAACQDATSVQGPLETREANAEAQHPTFAGQTRARGVTAKVAFKLTVLTKDLHRPWAVEPLPDGALLVTEKVGAMRIVSAAGEVGPPLAGLPPVEVRGQGGLLDVALSPNFATDRLIYWTFTEARGGGLNGTSLARGVLSKDRSRIEQAKVIFQSMPGFDGGLHFGSRLAFGPDGMLYMTMGERSDTQMRPHAQRTDSHLGKILRLKPDGTAPADNPFVGTPGAKPEIWSLGHRNVQSAAFDAQGRLWTAEMGPQGGDELNLIGRGKNYGWPLVSFGEEYSGQPIEGALTDRPGFEPPVYYWDPVIAPSGAQFYTGSAFPAWRGSLFLGSLREGLLVRLEIKGDRVVGEEHLLARKQRMRDVRQGPDGALYIVTDRERGELWKITPD